VLKPEFIREGGEAAPVTVPALFRHGLDGPPALPLPPVAEDGDLVGVSVRALEGPVQLLLIPRHEQYGPRRTWGLSSAGFRWRRHSSSR